tara:strand:- start:212 stop:925 length:714 start_codon:yes stop_codon:yes gene_type:complete
MREIIIDIDDSNSIKDVVNRISEDWFSPEEIYSRLKTNGKTNSSNFWNVTMVADVAEALNLKSAQFQNKWDQRCINHDAKIMGYHCTRSSNKHSFSDKGILPLSDETIKINEGNLQTYDNKSMWDYRTKCKPGPFLFLSYKEAKNPNNHFCLNGPEILLACSGHQVNSNPSNSIPLIIHCTIPYSILPEKSVYTFHILRAYFNFLDPEDDSTDIVKGDAIDMKGQPIDPKYIRIEKM